LSSRRDLEVSLLIFKKKKKTKLLFPSVKQIFLPFIFQLILLEESWSELFLLWAIQCSTSLDNGGPLFTTALNRYQLENENGKSIYRLLNDVLYRFKQLKLDPIEFACLKAIILFRFGRNSNLI
jgi:hypothetical protein